MRIAVTGGAGFIGGHLLPRLVARGHTVWVIDDLSSGRAEQVPPSCRLLQQDIRASETARALQQFQPDALIHLAAQMDVGASVRAPLHDAEVNVLGTLNLLQALQDTPCQQVLMASSGGAAYGAAAHYPTDESAPSQPLSPYGVSKLTGELYLRWWQTTGGRSLPRRWTALRLANVYGPGQNPHGEAGVVAIFCAAMLRGEAPRIHGDGLQTRDYVYVDDVARAFVACLEANATLPCGAYNVGTGREIPLITLTQQLAEQVGYGGAPYFGPAKAGEVRRSCLSAARLQRAVGWQPRVALAEGLARTVRAFRAAAVSGTKGRGRSVGAAVAAAAAQTRRRHLGALPGPPLPAPPGQG